ncbi:MAG TPA: glycosyltransferase family 2 protein [Candidatus Saccharimonadales bacterium]|nr:glycosyltransferase family 2 protein [Candidatus Saccharimonadales bacterium]
MKSNIRVSLVIPAYNEESHLTATLKAVSEQTVKPFEVIVVDNNSTDQTAVIARSFPFVTLLHEPRQGVVNARTTGFNTARGDIIGRIDGDTRIAPNWIETLQAVFADQSVDAVSGSVHYYDIPLTTVIDPIDVGLRTWMAKHMGSVYLWGANMGIRRSVWHKVAARVCNRKFFHEDLDLAVHLGKEDCRVIFESKLFAGISGRRIDTNPLSFWRYVWLNDFTYAQHGVRERLYMYPVLSLVVLFYAPLRIMYRGYDERTQHFSLRTLFAPPIAAGRVDPAVFHAD